MSKVLSLIKSSFFSIKIIFTLMLLSTVGLVVIQGESLFLSLIVTPMAMIVIGLYYIKKNEVQFNFSQNIIKVVSWGVLGFFLAILANILSSYILITDDFKSTTIVDLNNLTMNQITFIVGVAAPVAEELLFRAVYKDKIVDKMNLHPIWFLVISGLTFGLLHIDMNASLIDNFGIILMTFMSGIGFGYVYIRSESIYSSIIGHMLYNLLIISIM